MISDRIIVDARGLVCPYVAVKTKKVLNLVPADATITVLCTDPMAAIDLPVLATGLGRPHFVGPDFQGHFEVNIGAQLTDRPSADVWPILGED